MNTNRNNARAKGTKSAKKIEVNQNRKKFQQEEFGSEFEFDVASAQGETDIKQPVSERTAWH